MTVEDTLYAAWHRGIRKQVLKESSKNININEDQHIKMEKTYNEVLAKSINKGEIEINTWDSSMIISTSYNFKEEILAVEFKNNTEYSYQNITLEEYQEFLTADSKGKHFISSIRDKKEYTRL